MGDFCEMLFTARAAQQFDLSHAPGTSYSYSNIGATLAACAAEPRRIAARFLAADGTFDDLALGLVMAPLGVARRRRGGLPVRDIDAPRGRSRCRARARPRAVPRPLPLRLPRLRRRHVEGATASYAQLFATFVNNGTSPSGAALLRPATVAEMRREQYPACRARRARASSGTRRRACSARATRPARPLGGDLGVATDAFFDPDDGRRLLRLHERRLGLRHVLAPRRWPTSRRRILRTFGPYGGATGASVARRRDARAPPVAPG